jgi:hypothetical protein
MDKPVSFLAGHMTHTDIILDNSYKNPAPLYAPVRLILQLGLDCIQSLLKLFCLVHLQGVVVKPYQQE